MALKIFEKVYTARIIQHLEVWPYRVTRARANITRKVQALIEKIQPEDVVRKVSLIGSIQTVFWLYLGLSLVCMTYILIVEISWCRKLWGGLFAIKKWLYRQSYLKGNALNLK